MKIICNCMVLLLLVGCIPGEKKNVATGMLERQIDRPVMGDKVASNVKMPDTAFSTMVIPNTKRKLKSNNTDVHLPNGKLVISANNMPLIQFIHMAFREVLGVPYEASVGIRARMDPVSMSINKPVKAKVMLAMIEETLAIYGVSVLHEGKVWQIVSSQSLKGEIPTIVSDDIKEAVGQGRVMEFIPLKYVTSSELNQMSQYMLGSKGEAELVFLSRLNAVLVIGSVSRIRHFKKGIALLDRPSFAGKKLLLIQPTFWDASSLKGALLQTLNAEGIPVGVSGVRLIVIPENDTLIVSSPNSDWFDRVKVWVSELDRASVRGNKPRSFIYFVKNSKAENIGAIAEKVLNAIRKVSAVHKGKRKENAEIVIDKFQNSILFIGTALQYKEFLDLMNDLDRPRRSVLIEVTVAEVTLNHNMQFGVEWQGNNIMAGRGGKLSGSTDLLGTLGGLGLGAGGLSYSMTSLAAGAVNLKLHALADEGRVKLLSNPTLLALDGEKSRLQVGTQLPIISQETSAAGTTTGIVRTFNMVDTGVILNITPVIHEGGMVELTLNQEVSEAGQSTNNTPPILKRSIQTVLETKSGQSVLIGGLISHNNSIAESKVPFLSAIPILGSFFRTKTKTDRVTELVIIITPHVIYQSSDLDYYKKAFKMNLSDQQLRQVL